MYVCSCLPLKSTRTVYVYIPDTCYAHAGRPRFQRFPIRCLHGNDNGGVFKIMRFQSPKRRYCVNEEPSPLIMNDWEKIMEQTMWESCKSLVSNASSVWLWHSFTPALLHFCTSWNPLRKPTYHPKIIQFNVLIVPPDDRTLALKVAS